MRASWESVCLSSTSGPSTSVGSHGGWCESWDDLGRKIVVGTAFKVQEGTGVSGSDVTG
jgi:hypothetical protein